jgi:methionine sulfoxide reductase heme-binding subunit
MMTISPPHPTTNQGLFARIWHAPLTFWLLLALPAIPMLFSMADGSYRGVIHGSGEFAARFTIFAMVLTPLVMLFPQTRALRWLMKRRRHIGVAAFGYAALHTLAYLLHEANLSAIINDIAKAGIWTGWLAFLIFVPLALTSNDWSLRRLGTWWKPLQRWTYAAALMTVAHWFFLEYEIGPALVHFGPLAALEVYRVVATRRRRASRAAIPA